MVLLDPEALVFGQGINFFHIENLALSHVLIRALFMATGLYWRGISNAAKIDIRLNRIELPNLPKAFDGFTIVQLSDLHAIAICRLARQRSTGSRFS